MTYQIIGGDGREYGPVTDAELRKWIAEGRLNAQSQARAESDTAFRPLSTFPEFADAFGTAASMPGATPWTPPTMDWSKRDYELDIGGCISRGWTLFMDNLGILLGCTALYLLIAVGGAGIVNAILGGILSKIVPDTIQYSATFIILQSMVLQAITVVFVGPMAGGYYYLFIRALRGQTASVGDLFIGFQKAFSRLFIGLLINNMVMVISFIPFDIVWAARAGPVLLDLKHSPNPGAIHGLLQDLLSAFTSACPIMLLCMIPAFYLATNFWFTLPLIIDQGMDVWTAIKTSWKMVHKHWFTVFGLVLLTGIISVVGFCLCCIGAFFTVGIATAASMFAYETIFCESRRD